MILRFLFFLLFATYSLSSWGNVSSSPDYSYQYDDFHAVEVVENYSYDLPSNFSKTAESRSSFFQLSADKLAFVFSEGFVAPKSAGPLKNASGCLDDAARAARTQPHQREITQHANQRLQTRDKRVTNDALETAITRGQRNFDPATGKTVHNLPASQSPTGRGVTTVTNHRGGVITVIDNGRKFDP